MFFLGWKDLSLVKKVIMAGQPNPLIFGLVSGGRYVKGGRLTSHEANIKNGKTYCCSSNHHGSEQYGQWRTT